MRGVYRMISSMDSTSSGTSIHPFTSVKKTPIGMMQTRQAMPSHRVSCTVSRPLGTAPLPPLNGVRRVL
jgi:hypothetical protein